MRILFCILITLGLSFSAQAQTKSINKFYNKYRFKKEVYNMSLPGWLVRMGLGIGKNYMDDTEEIEIALDLAKKVRKMKLMVMDNSNLVKNTDFKALISGVREDGFEDLVTVRDEGTKVNILIREQKDKIRNMLILVNEPDEFIMLSLKTKLTMDDLNELINEFAKEELL